MPTLEIIKNKSKQNQNNIKIRKYIQNNQNEIKIKSNTSLTYPNRGAGPPISVYA